MKLRVLISFVGGIVAFVVMFRLLRGLIPEAAAFGLAILAMMLVGYPATRYITDNPKLSFAKWAAASALGAAVGAISFTLW